MFLKKIKQRIKELEDRIEYIERSKIGPMVFCEECGVAIDRSMAKMVKVIKNEPMFGEMEEKEYYCDRHAPNYDKKITKCGKEVFNDGGLVFKWGYETKYYKDNVEVKGKKKK